MRFLMSDLEERSGLTARTIRDYIKHGFLPPPNGHGLAASYDEEQMLRVVTIARMRAQRASWPEVVTFLGNSTLAKLRAFVKKTDPAPPDPPPAAAPPPAERPAGEASNSGAPARLEGQPAPRGLPPTGAGAAHEKAIDVEHDDDALLEGAVGFAMVNVLPGLALMVRSDASPLVKRVAREIVRKYSAR
jgi:hypothetical protein